MFALVLVGFLCFMADAQDRPAKDIVLADFEGKTYGDWAPTGTAFGSGPARGTLPGQMHVDGFLGKGLVNSFHQGDGSTGTLTSPPFKIERQYLTFLIGGGKNPGKTCINLLIDSKVVRTSTGPNDKPGGSETLAPASWHVSDLLGKTAQIQIVDVATGGWGHINIDHIVVTDRKPPGLLSNVEREIPLEHRYVQLPIKRGAKKRQVTILIDGHPVVQNEVELADDKPDWWAPIELAGATGKRLTVRVDKLSEDSKALQNIVTSNTLQNSEKLYQEPLRGQIHFSGRRGWLNDPNGLVFYNGEYHLFFQHNPYGWDWGNMHWGHAVSKDMVHWEELGDVLLPDKLGPMFSGSAVVDWNNTSGFGKDGKPPLVLIYTAAGNPTTQCIAYSTDGRTFTKYEQNPVVKQITSGNRDPKVMWHAPSKQWVMVLYVELNKRHTVHFFTSSNLKDWKLASITEGGTMGKDGYLYECPDFFELPIDGDKVKTKWVLLGANSEYAIGTFDGTTFKPEQTWLKGYHGRGFYAPQTFSDIPVKDGRRIQIGWFQTATPGMEFNQSMSIPMELKLVSTGEGPRLARVPVKELEKLRIKTHSALPMTMKTGNVTLKELMGQEILSNDFKLQTELMPGEKSLITFDLHGVAVAYDSSKKELVVNGHRVAAPLVEGKLKLDIYVDRTGVEVFANQGMIYVPIPVNISPANRNASFTVSNEPCLFGATRLYQLDSIWQTKR
jgi:sucrose-6-phosphate hydrolase SacC (GH32 family)